MKLLKDIKIPIIVNGDLFGVEDINLLWNEYGNLVLLLGIRHFMIARGAQNNISIFKVLSEYMKELNGVETETKSDLVNSIEICKIL